MSQCVRGKLLGGPAADPEEQGKAEQAPHSEDQRAVGPMAPHPDPLVDPDGRRILRPDEQAHRRHRSSSNRQRSRIPRCALPLAPRGWIDPHLLDLDGRRRPRRGLRLEPDRTVLAPTPRTAPPRSASGSASGSLPGHVPSDRSPISSSCAAAHAGSSSSKSRRLQRASRSRRDSGGSEIAYTGCPGRSSRGAGINPAITAQSSSTARSSHAANSCRGSNTGDRLAQVPPRLWSYDLAEPGRADVVVGRAAGTAPPMTQRRFARHAGP